jgi:hypothetical protein
MACPLCLESITGVEGVADLVAKTQKDRAPFFGTRSLHFQSLKVVVAK